MFSTLSEARKKYCDLMIGALKETMARRIVAMSVTRNPGVAGLNIIAVQLSVASGGDDDGGDGG